MVVAPPVPGRESLVRTLHGSGNQWERRGLIEGHIRDRVEQPRADREAIDQITRGERRERQLEAGLHFASEIRKALVDAFARDA
ncbi:MAG: hypothetical protein ABI467_13070 [Kofleriaceae bacterium]